MYGEITGNNSSKNSPNNYKDNRYDLSTEKKEIFVLSISLIVYT